MKQDASRRSGRRPVVPLTVALGWAVDCYSDKTGVDRRYTSKNPKWYASQDRLTGRKLPSNAGEESLGVVQSSRGRDERPVGSRADEAPSESAFSFTFRSLPTSPELGSACFGSDSRRYCISERSVTAG